MKNPVTVKDATNHVERRWRLLLRMRDDTRCLLLLGAIPNILHCLGTVGPNHGAEGSVRRLMAQLPNR